MRTSPLSARARVRATVSIEFGWCRSKRAPTGMTTAVLMPVRFRSVGGSGGGAGFQRAQAGFFGLQVFSQLGLERRIGDGGQGGARLLHRLTTGGDQARQFVRLMQGRAGGSRTTARLRLFFLGGLHRGGLPGGGRVAQGVLDRIAALELAGRQQGGARDDEDEGANPGFCSHQPSIQFGIQPSWNSRTWATGIRNSSPFGPEEAKSVPLTWPTTEACSPAACALAIRASASETATR